MSLRIERYSPDVKQTWNDFLKEAKNGLFLFDRDYMEYHSDRFTDHSLLFYNDKELVCILPATEANTIFSSHAGLTYGGFVMSKRATASFVLSAMQELVIYLKQNSFKTFFYKSIPYIYYHLPAQEDLYALFRCEAEIYRRDISSIIDLKTTPTYTKGTRYNLSKARKNLLRVEESVDFKTFMRIEEELLKAKYGTKPTHTTEEIILLAGRFPENIKLFLVFKNDTCLGGTIIYQTENIIHTQYIGITDEGKEIGALDFVTDYLIATYSSTHTYFSFGISTVDGGLVLNEGLIKNKESFGARAIVHDFYKIDL